MEIICITQKDNDNYFEQKLSTWTYGLCRIERKVRNISPDPLGGFQGIIIRRNKPNLKVTSDDKVEWDIVGEVDGG